MHSSLISFDWFEERIDQHFSFLVVCLDLLLRGKYLDEDRKELASYFTPKIPQPTF